MAVEEVAQGRVIVLEDEGTGLPRHLRAEELGGRSAVADAAALCVECGGVLLGSDGAACPRDLIGELPRW